MNLVKGSLKLQQTFFCIFQKKILPHPFNRRVFLSNGTMDFYEVDLDEFCYRQFDEKNKSCSFIPYDKDQFLEKVNDLIRKKEIKVTAGYAPFCKHIFIDNFTEATVETVPISDDNKHLIQSGYIQRNEKELPVLTRWISRSDLPSVKKAKYLDLILYSSEQIEKENKAMNNIPSKSSNCLYSIIAIKPQDLNYELPMAPITMLRNALIEEGGSGVKLDREKYKESVNYWSHHVAILNP